MKFGQTIIPQEVHDIARSRMENALSFTPDDIRSYLLEEAAGELQAVSDISVNQRIMADRVFRAELKKLVAENAVGQFKRGLWMKRSIIDAK